jgi:type IV secretory pathway VirB2 component (pilin)
MKTKKINSFLCSLVLLLICFNNMVFAAGSVNLGNDVLDTLKEITQVLLIVAAGVCVGKVIHIGILYLTSTAIEKSNAKQALFPWILGTIICFGAATIGGAIIKIFLDSVGNGPVLGI